MNDPEVFRGQLDTIFVAQRNTQQVDLRLLEIEDERTGRGIQQFSLLFQGPAENVLPQGTYEFQHSVLGALAIFITPIVGLSDERTLYQACFSRPAPRT